MCFRRGTVKDVLRRSDVGQADAPWGLQALVQAPVMFMPRLREASPDKDESGGPKQKPASSEWLHVPLPTHGSAFPGIAHTPQIDLREDA